MNEIDKKENAVKFLAELKDLAKKYGVRNFSICGDLDEKFFGVVGADTDGFGEFFEAVLNVARLHQSSREKVKLIMDDREK
jgi:hypothetical protein